MTRYAVLLPGDEDYWEQLPAEGRQIVYDLHEKFAKALEERGHKVVGGAELTHSSTARTVRGTAEGLVVTDGPYAEAVEQLTGFYVIDSDDLDDLVELTKILADPAHGGIEIRACTGDGGNAS
jgi:hypothetical protein